MGQPIHFLDDENLRKEVALAIRDLASLVSVTLGPGGRPVLLEQSDGKAPLSTKDGVTVARHFAGRNAISRVVADTAREVCERTARIAGDGTTTAIVLADSLVREGQSYIKNNPSVSPQKLTRDLRDIFLKKIKPMILELSKPIKGLPKEQGMEAITHVAKVSANHDIEIADAVSKGVDLVGEDGMIIAEEGAGAETTVLHSDGFPVNTGLKDLGGSASTAFVNGSAGEARLSSGAYVLLYDGEIRETEALIPILNAIHSEVDESGNQLRTPLVIFCHGYSDQVLKILAQNFRQGRFSCIPLVTPRNGQAHYRQSFLHDMSAYVGGIVFDPHGTILSQASPENLGFLATIRAGQSETVITANPDVERIEARIEELKKQMDSASDFDKDRIRYRIGQLNGGVATVFAGGVTGLESKERHARVVDAISAVKSAMDLGVVPGGGSTLLYIAGQLNEVGPEGIFRKSLMVPFAQILRNAGALSRDVSGEEESAVISDIGPTEDGGFMVFDALEMKYVDWWKAGILDPAKVTLTALENALSVAQLLMTLGGLVALSHTEGEQQVKAMQEGLMRAINQEV
jgi:chaperonin GroEL